MILTIDIGNSNIVSALYNWHGERMADDRRETLKVADAHAYNMIFSYIERALYSDDYQAIILSCVVPAITDCVAQALAKRYRGVKLINLSYNSAPPFNCYLDRPHELGADIIATTFGAFHKYKQPTIIADLGSATKITLIEEQQTFSGGIIMPGMYFMAKSLHSMIPQLPVVEMEKPQRRLGRNTIESIQSGIINGTLCSIIEQAERIEEECGRPCTWVITGGLSKLFSKEELSRYQYDEFLLSDGLFAIAKNLMGDNYA